MADLNERHVMEITPLPDEPFHALGGQCWCQPTIEEVLPQGRLVIHRRTLDSPRYEAPADFGTQELGSGRIPRDLLQAIDDAAARRARRG